MKLTVKLEEIHYGQVAVKALPLLSAAAGQSDGAMGKLLQAISQLPEKMICDIFDAIPAQQKNGIVAALATEHKGSLLPRLNRMSERYRVGVTLADYLVGEDLEMTLLAKRLDYLVMVERFLPVIREKLLNMGGVAGLMRPVIQGASAGQVCGLLDRLLGSNKDAFLASLINQNQRTLISALEEIGEKQGIHLKIQWIRAEA